jgi:hypothetical protein
VVFLHVFLKKLVLRRFITPLLGVFDQIFFEKVCCQVFKKARASIRIVY